MCHPLRGVLLDLWFFLFFCLLLFIQTPGKFCHGVYSIGYGLGWDLVWAFDWLKMVRKSTVFVLAAEQTRYIKQPAYPFSATNNAMWMSVRGRSNWRMLRQGIAFKNYLPGLQNLNFLKKRFCYLKSSFSIGILYFEVLSPWDIQKY